MESCKKRKLEDGNHSNLNSCANVAGGSGHKFTNLCKTTAIKDDEVLQKYNDVVVKGLNLIFFYFIITCFNTFLCLLCCLKLLFINFFFTFIMHSSNYKKLLRCALIRRIKIQHNILDLTWNFFKKLIC